MAVGFVDARLDGLPVPHPEHKAVPGRHVPATGEEDGADAVLTAAAGFNGPRTVGVNKEPDVWKRRRRDRHGT